MRTIARCIIFPILCQAAEVGLYRLKMADRSDRVSLAHRNAKRRYSMRLRRLCVCVCVCVCARARTFDSACRVKEASSRLSREGIFHALFFRAFVPPVPVAT